jgi:hypothetical protein
MNTKTDSTTIFKMCRCWTACSAHQTPPEYPIGSWRCSEDRSRILWPDKSRWKLSFSSGASSLSIDQAVTDDLPKRLLFGMVGNDSLDAIDTNPNRFQNFGKRTYAMFVNGRQVPNETPTFDTGHKTSVMAYKTIWGRELGSSGDPHVYKRILHVTLTLHPT